MGFGPHYIRLFSVSIFDALYPAKFWMRVIAQDPFKCLMGSLPNYT